MANDKEPKGQKAERLKGRVQEQQAILEGQLAELEAILGLIQRDPDGAEALISFFERRGR